MFDATCTTPKSTPADCAGGRRRLAPNVLLVLFVLFAFVLGASGCGPIEVRRAPPGTDLDGVAIDGETLVLRLIVDNRNDVAMTLSGARLGLTLGTIELEGREWPLRIDIGPRGREAIDLEMPASGAALGLLDELEAGERSSLRYRLEGQLQIADGRDTRVDRNGYLHPVPGRPGRYR